jgi:hypothetical protein
MLARLERLEHLQLLGSGGSGGGSTFAGPIVADEAAASALAGLVEGEQIFVLSHRSIWVKRITDPPALLPHEVIASAGGGVLVRTAYSDPAWRIGIDNVYIDPVNGNDENQGIYVGTPGTPLALRTGAELARRWGQQNTIRASGVVGTAPNYITVNVLNDMPATDKISLNISIDSSNGSAVRIIGLATVLLLAGNLDAVGGFTAENPAAAGGGTKALIKSGATVWTPFIGERIRFTATGIVAGIMTDEGGGTASINAPSLSGFQTIFGTATLANPANGAAFRVEKLTHINMSSPVLTCQSTVGSPPMFAATTVQLVDVDVTGDFNWAAECTGNVTFQPYQSTFTQDTVNFSFGLVLAFLNLYSSCVFRQLSFTFKSPYDSTGELNACGVVQTLQLPASNVDLAIIRDSAGQSGSFFGSFVNSTLFQNGRVIFEGICKAHDFAVFAGSSGARGQVMIGGHTTFEMQAGSTLQMRARMWGNAGPLGTGYGLQFQVQCSLGVGATVPNITGPSGDVGPVSLVVPAASQQRWWWFDDDPASATVGTYQPAAGISPFTWAAFAAGRGPAGFGGYAHNPAVNNHISSWNTN